MKPHDLHIAAPCHARWSAMDGDETRRFCHECNKHVHNLSAMTSQEAHRLVNHGGPASLCVRYSEEPTGSIRFTARRVPATSPLPQQHGASRLLQAASSAVSMLLALAAGRATAEPQPMMGQEPTMPGDAPEYLGMEGTIEGELVTPCEGSAAEGSGEATDGSGEAGTTCDPALDPDGPTPVEVWMGESPDTPSIQGGLPIPEDMLREMQPAHPKSPTLKQVAPLGALEARAATQLARYWIVVEDVEIGGE